MSNKKDRASRQMFKKGTRTQQDFNDKFWSSFSQAESEMKPVVKPETGFQPTLYAVADDLGNALKKSGFDVVQAEVAAGEEVKRNLFYIRSRGQR